MIYAHSFVTNTINSHFFLQWKKTFYAHLFVTKTIYALFCHKKNWHTLFLARKQFTRLFLSRKRFTHFFVVKTIYALRPESVCALKVAIRKVQTFWASGHSLTLKIRSTITVYDPCFKVRLAQLKTVMRFVGQVCTQRFSSSAPVLACILKPAWEGGVSSHICAAASDVDFGPDNVLLRGLGLGLAVRYWVWSIELLS